MEDHLYVGLTNLITWSMDFSLTFQGAIFKTLKSNITIYANHTELAKSVKMLFIKTLHIYSKIYTETFIDELKIKIAYLLHYLY